MDLKKAVDILSRSNYRITQTRLEILQSMFKLKSPFSAYDVLNSFPKKAKNRPVDLATIYRNLRVFEQKEIVCRTDFSDEMVRYMVAEPGHRHHHHHIKCRGCQSVAPVDFCTLDAQIHILEKLGFKNIAHRLEFTGLCPNCA